MVDLKKQFEGLRKTPRYEKSRQIRVAIMTYNLLHNDNISTSVLADGIKEPLTIASKIIEGDMQVPLELYEKSIKYINRLNDVRSSQP